MRRRIAELARRWGRHPAFAAIGKRTVPHIDRFLHRVSGGRLGLSSLAVPTLMLVHTGRKSGRRYRTPLAYLPRGDSFVVVGSNWGQAHHPQWALNLLAHPEAEVELRGRTIPVRARVLDGEEREEVWEELLRMWPAFETYAERAAGRRIRIFQLDPR